MIDLTIFVDEWKGFDENKETLVQRAIHITMNDFPTRYISSTHFSQNMTILERFGLLSST